MGNRRKPRERKKLEGTDQPCRRNTAEPELQVGEIDAPTVGEMTELQRACFDELAWAVKGQRVSYPQHRLKLWQAARALAMVVMLKEQVDRDGVMVEGEPHKALVRLEKWDQQLRMLLGDFGLDPCNMGKSHARKDEGKHETALSKLMDEMRNDQGEEVPS